MKKPSILFITTDEQHINTISAFGAKSHTTPNIDNLINQSDVYHNAYSASPVCLPARCTWMTGRYPHKSGCISNFFGASLPLQNDNIFTSLKKQGYTTSMHGKCHFIPVPYAATFSDITLEYEHFITYYKALGMDHLDLQDDKNNSMWYYDDYGKELEKKGLMETYRYLMHHKKESEELNNFPGPKEMHPDSWVGQKAIEYLDQLNDESPHMMWVSFSGPHYPMDVPEEYMDKVDISKDNKRITKENEWDDVTKLHYNGYHGPGTTEGSVGAPGGAQKNYTKEYWSKWRQFYYANVVQIDEYIGKIISKAKEKWGEDLCIIFTSDHGDMMGNHNLWGKNNSLAEDVIRIPMVVHQPGQNKRRDYKEVVSSLEVFPTILKYANADLSGELDGLEIQKMVEKGGRDYILSTCGDRLALIKDNIKLVWNKYERTNQMYYELYDLIEDPYEFNNYYNDKRYEQKKSELENMLYSMEEKEKLLSTVFYKKGMTPYWLNNGEGTGLMAKDVTL